MPETFAVPAKGIGKPDYTNEVSSSLERKGLRLAYKQTLGIFGIIFSAVPSAFSWVTTPLPPGGAHTGGPHATVMTNGAAILVPNTQIGRIIENVTDGSSGVIIANTVNTVTVAALVGGTLNQWSLGDLYRITVHLIDNITGLALPFTIPQGYTLSLIAGGYALTEDAIEWFYLDGFRVLAGGVLPGGNFAYENRIIAISTALIDPTGATPHTIDAQLTNVGAGNLEGGVDLTGILEEVGSPPRPTTKTVRCKFCGYEETVPLETAQWICPKCGKLNMFYNLTKFRGS